MNEYEEKLKSVVKGKTVVYIDVANLEQSIKDMFVRPDDIPDNLKHLSADTLRWSVDYKKFNDFFKTVGDFHGVHFYTAEFQEEGHHKFRYLFIFPLYLAIMWLYSIITGPVPLEVAVITFLVWFVGILLGSFFNIVQT
jgi:hypothetical protein